MLSYCHSTGDLFKVVLNNCPAKVPERSHKDHPFCSQMQLEEEQEEYFEYRHNLPFPSFLLLPFLKYIQEILCVV